MKILTDVDEGILTRKEIYVKYGITKSTLSTIIKSREKVDSAIAKGLTPSSKKRLRFGAQEDLEEKLLQWFKNMRSSQIPISGPLIKTKAKELSSQLGVSNFECSDGWLWRFQKRNNISSHVVSGEASKVDETCVNDWLKVFDIKKSSYAEKDIFNLDETGVFFHLLPDRTLDFKGVKCHGGAKSKARLTVVLCCNADGTEKMKLWVIGKYQNPRCLKNVNRLRLPCNYSHHKKAWIDGPSFREWLLKLQRRMASEKRKILLTLDNCSAHKCDDLDLQNIEIVFFPPNATSRIQPLDQGIIYCLKREYRKRLLNAVIVNIEANQPTIKWNVLQAMRALSAAWDNISEETIKNCFKKAWTSSEQPLEILDSADDPEEWIAQKYLIGAPDTLSQEEFVNIDYNVSVAETFEAEEQDVDEPDEEEETDDEEVLRKPSRKEVMEALSVIQRLGDTTEVEPEFTASLHKLMSACDKLTRPCLSQKKITDFF